MNENSESDPKPETNKSKPCSWCQKEQGIKPLPGESHGICEKHKAEFLDQLKEINFPANPET